MFCYYFSFFLFSYVKISFINIIASIIIFINSLIFSSRFFILIIIKTKFIYSFMYLFIYLFIYFFCCCCFFSLSNSLCHMKRLWLVDYFVNLFVCSFVLSLKLKLQGNYPQLHYFSPVPKRFAIFFIYFHFYIILHFNLNFILFCLFCHSLYDGFSLTDFMAVTSKQNVLVAP